MNQNPYFPKQIFFNPSADIQRTVVFVIHNAVGEDTVEFKVIPEDANIQDISCPEGTIYYHEARRAVVPVHIKSIETSLELSGYYPVGGKLFPTGELKTANDAKFMLVGDDRITSTEIKKIEHQHLVYISRCRRLFPFDKKTDQILQLEQAYEEVD